MEENNCKCIQISNLPTLNIKSQLNMNIDSNTHIKQVLNIEACLIDSQIEPMLNKALIKGTIGIKVVYVDIDNMYNSLSDSISFSETLNNDSISSGCDINIVNSQFFAEFDNDDKTLRINIDGNIDVDTLDNNTVVEFGVYSSYQGTLTPYPFNSDQHIAIYVALLDSSDNFYTMCLLQGYNDSCLDDGSQHCFVRLKDLLEKDSSGNTNTVLDSTWKFRLFGISHGVTEMSASTIVFKYTMYEPIKAGSGGGSSINEATLYSPYSSLSTYNINDLVIYNNNLYKCITAVTTAEAFDSNKWLNTSLSTEITDNTNSLGGLKLVKMNSATYANLPTYDNNTLYVIKD